MKHYRVLVLAGALLLVLLPIFVRVSNDLPVIAGEQSYYHARMAELVLEGKSTDPLLEGRPVPYSPYHVILAIIQNVLPFPFYAILFSVLLGMLSVFLFGLCLQQYGIKHEFFVLLLFVLSPFFATTFSQAFHHSLIVVLFLATVFVSAKPGSLWTFFTVALVVLQALSSPISALFGVITPYCVARVSSVAVRRAKLSAAFGALAFLLVTLPRWFAFGATPVAERDFLRLIADFGNPLGISIFALLLALIGFVVVWKHKKRYYVLYSVAFLTLVLAVLFSDAVPYASIIIALFGGVAFGTFASTRWRLREIKALTILVIFCGLLFSTLSVTLDFAQGMPSAEMQKAGEWLAEQPPGIVLSHPKNGHWISFFGHQPILLDNAVPSTPTADIRWADIQKTFGTADIELARRLLRKYGVKYVLVTREMKEGLVWERPEQNFLFLLENSKTFKKRFHTGTVEIWEYVGK